MPGTADSSYGVCADVVQNEEAWTYVGNEDGSNCGAIQRW
jgi:hypothetical protein